MYDRHYSASLIIACEGNSNSDILMTPYGEIRSRDGAKLKYVTNDARGVYYWWSKDSSVPMQAHIYLENPTKSDVKNAIDKINLELSSFDQGNTGIDIYFAGHGEYNSGSLVLKDESLGAIELIDMIIEPLDPKKGVRGISLMLDSCYSGSFLIDVFLTLDNSTSCRLFDAMASCLPNEKSWELSFLEHGAYTFSRLNPGNSHVEKNELTKAIEKNDYKIIAKCIQGLVSSMASPVSFLTLGKQHSIECFKGLEFSINGHGSFSLADYNTGTVTREQLINLIYEAKDSIWNNN